MEVSPLLFYKLKFHIHLFFPPNFQQREELNKMTVLHCKFNKDAFQGKA